MQSLQVSNFFSHIKLSKFAYFWRFSHINVTLDSDSIKVIIMAKNTLSLFLIFHGCTSLQQLVKNFQIYNSSPLTSLATLSSSYSLLSL